jgi:hypothetical protein
MLFNIPFIANWNKIGDYRQRLTDLSTAHKNNKQINYDYKVGNKVLVTQEGILCKQKAHTAKSHGLSPQFIQMRLSGFNAEHNWKVLTSGE